MTDEQRAREIDALVATEVMGEPMPAYTHDPHRAFNVYMAGSPIESPGGAWLLVCLYEEGDVPRWMPRAFSTTWEGMGLVVEKMREEGWFWSVGNWSGDDAQCWFAWIERDLESADGAVYDMSAETLPMAVCRVALYARGVDVAALVGGET